MNTPGIFETRAPVRADLAGGGTDCPPFSTDHGGAVVNIGIGLYARARIEIYTDDSRVDVVSRDFDETVSAQSLAEIKIDGKLDLLKGIALRMNPDWGFKLTVRSDVPPGSGLGSSGAVGVACVAAFDAAMGIQRTPSETAQLANDIERNDLGYSGGDQDSFGPAFGGFNLLTYSKGGAMTPRTLQLTTETLAAFQKRALLVYTGEPHLSGNIHQDIKESYALPNSPTVDAMKNLARIGRACAAALEAGDLEAFGALLNENWVHHQRLHHSCNCEQLQRYFDALAPVSTGAKTCGAGGGGCILFLLEEGEQDKAKTLCQELGGQVLPFSIDHIGVALEQHHVL